MSIVDRFMDFIVLTAALVLVVLRMGTGMVDQTAPHTGAIYAMAFRSSSAGPYPVEVAQDITYARVDHTGLRLDLYFPVGAPSPRPAILALHPGGWNDFAKSTIAGMSRTLATNGFVVAAIDYRLSPAAPWPACLEDCKEAVRWLRVHAGRYGIDPGFIGAIGDSAGGHLALMLGVTSPEDGFEGQTAFPETSSRIQAAASYYGPTDLTEMLGVEVSSSTVPRLIGSTLRESPEAYRGASPMSYITPGDTPVLLVHGKKDALVGYGQSLRFAQALQGVGGEAVVLGVENADHLLLRKGGRLHPSLTEVDRRVVEFFRSHLGPGNPNE